MEISAAGKLIPIVNNIQIDGSKEFNFTQNELDIIDYVDGQATLLDISKKMNKSLEDMYLIMGRLIKDEIISLEIVKESEPFLRAVYGFLKMQFDKDAQITTDESLDSQLGLSDDDVKAWDLIDQLDLEMSLDTIEAMAAQKTEQPTKSSTGDWDMDSLFRFINEIHNSKKTGRLQIKGSDEEVKNLFFKDGNLWNAFSKPFKPEECLGRILQRAGKLENAEVISSLKSVLKTGRLQGEELVLMGKIHSTFLRKALRFQIETKLKPILSWKKGTFNWIEVEKLPSRIVNVDIPLPSILFNMLWKHIPEKEIAREIREQRNKWMGQNFDPPYNLEDFKFGGIFTRSIEVFFEKDLQIEKAIIISNLKKDQTPKMIWILKKLEMIQFLDDTRADKSEMRVEEIKSRLNYAEKRKFFELLQVHWSANDQMIRNGYEKSKREMEKEITNAKDLELELLKELMRNVELAFDTLRTHKKRMEFRSSVFDESIIEANSEIFRQKAESFLFTKDMFADAIKEAESAMEIYQGDGETFAVLGLAKFFFGYPGNKAVYEHGRELLNLGKKMLPTSEMVNLCLGMMYRKEKMIERARKYYSTVLEINPGNRFARLELKEIESGTTTEAADKKAILQEFLDQRSDADKKFDQMIKDKKKA